MAVRINFAWILGRKTDAYGLLLPLFLTPILAYCLATLAPELSPAALYFCILTIDVAHVYTTYFRSYGHGRARNEINAVLWFLPVLCLVGLCLLYQLGPQWFWRVLAYVAAFHFVKQQYGIYMLYRHKGQEARPNWLEKAVVYGATVAPLLYWHLAPERTFHWFVADDFWHWESEALAIGCLALYGICLAWFVKVQWQTVQRGTVNAAKWLWLLGTLVSWWVSIVFTNDDVMFTLCNVIAHGLPYMVLVFGLHREDISHLAAVVVPSHWVRWRGLQLSLFVLFALILAYSEEWFWDVAVWRQHPEIFGWDPVLESFPLAPGLSPLLALPQVLHYCLDGFLWRLRLAPQGLQMLTMDLTSRPYLCNNAQK